MRLIFELYLNGSSLNMIQDEPNERGILSPSGKGTWCRQSINLLLINEKYGGEVLLMKSVNANDIGSKRVQIRGQSEKYLALPSHPPIIDKEAFEEVQLVNINRSNIMQFDALTRGERHSIRQRSDFLNADMRILKAVAP